MALWIEIVKFLAGWIASDMFAHASLLSAKAEPKLLGIHFTGKTNKIIIAFDLVALAVLVYVGWFVGW